MIAIRNPNQFTVYISFKPDTPLGGCIPLFPGKNIQFDIESFSVMPIYVRTNGEENAPVQTAEGFNPWAD